MALQLHAASHAEAALRVRLRRIRALGYASKDVEPLSDPTYLGCVVLKPFGVATPRPFALLPP